MSLSLRTSSLEGETDTIVLKHSQQKQRVITEFLQSQEETGLNVSRRLKQVCGDDAVNQNTVTRRMKQSSNGQEELGQSDFCNRPRNGRPTFTYHSVSND